jgi:adhesin/invasin
VARTGSNNVVADGLASSTITVTVRDGAGNALSGRTVTLDDAGNASVIGAASGPSDVNGVVTFTVTSTVANTATYTATADAVVITSATPTVTFVAGTVAAGTSTVTAPAGTVTANGVASKTITVTLLDASSNPVANKTVTLADNSTTSSITPASGTSNASGIVTFTVTNTVAEDVTYTATATDGTAITITDTEVVSFVAGAQTNLQVLTTQSLTDTVAASVTAPSVRVRDAQGNPVGGVNVTFTLASSGPGGAINGGTVAVIVPSNGTTGIASLASWQLGQTVGANTVTVSAPSVTNVVFTATGTAGTATQIAANSVLTQDATVATQVAAPPSVIVRDQFNNVVSNVSVTFTLQTTGGTGGAISPISPAAVATSSLGVATLSSWTVGQTAGSGNNTVQATVAGLTLTGEPVNFAASGIPGTATNIIANSTTTQSQTVGQAVTAPPSVRVRDAYNNPVDSVDVTFTVTAGSGTIAPVTATPVRTGRAGTPGVATLTSWTLGTAAGTNTVKLN